MGIAAHSTQPGEFCLLQNAVITLDKLDEDRHVAFFQGLAAHIKPSNEGGRVDIFTPLAASGTK